MNDPLHLERLLVAGCWFLTIVVAQCQNLQKEIAERDARIEKLAADARAARDSTLLTRQVLNRLLLTLHNVVN